MNLDFILNFSTSILAYLITGIASIWIAPFIVKNIGIEAYGLIPLVQMFINFLTIITMTFSSMIGRFFTISRTKEEFLEADEYISTSYYTMFFLSIIIFIILLLITINLEYLIEIPNFLLNDTKALFMLQGISFILLTMNVAFQAIPYCNNKLYINSMSNSISAFVRTLLIMIFMQLFVAHIWQVGLATVISNFISLFIGYIVYRNLKPRAKIKFEFFNFNKLKEMIALGIWQSINYAGSLFYLQSDLLIANWNLGAKIAGEYSILIQWSSLIRAFGNSIASIFSPTYVRLYAKKNYEEIVEYSNKAISFVGVIIGLMAGFIGGNGKSLLRVWIGSDFEKNAYLLIIIAISLSVNVCISPLFALLSTYKKVKVPAIMQIIIGLGNFVLAYIVTGSLNLGILGLIFISFISYSMINIVFMPIYISKITRQKFYKYYKGVINSVICFVISFIIFNIIEKIIFIDNWFLLILSGIFGSLIYLIIIFFIILKKYKDLILNLVCKK